ncbi:hypothetical protein ANN_13117 [Periplaneta americana]|uniref:Reverse transcriptase domain-containing protein n=1 Tax=Periplaneta americana TaxID=6978 RepID=A0ABQ8TJW5_PERAM|nr:hypothetical protein ANN_13117 [Periplaneta americana]
MDLAFQSVLHHWQNSRKLETVKFKNDIQREGEQGRPKVVQRDRLLNNIYKIYAEILTNKLLVQTETLIPEQQFGFMKEKETNSTRNQKPDGQHTRCIKATKREILYSIF